MQAKKRRLPDNWMNIVIALLIIVIIVAAVLYVITSPGESVEIVDIEDVLENSEEYVGETISVEGYFYYLDDYLGEMYPKVRAGGSSVYDPRNIPLQVDVENLNTTLGDGVKYRFTGVLEKVETGEFGDSYILKVDEYVAI